MLEGLDFLHSGKVIHRDIKGTWRAHALERCLFTTTLEVCGLHEDIQNEDQSLLLFFFIFKFCNIIYIFTLIHSLWRLCHRALSEANSRRHWLTIMLADCICFVWHFSQTCFLASCNELSNYAGWLVSTESWSITELFWIGVSSKMLKSDESRLQAFLFERLRTFQRSGGACFIWFYLGRCSSLNLHAFMYCS